MKETNELIKFYEGQEITFRENEGNYEVRVNEVAKFCNWINISKGKEYVNWTRVNEHLKTLGCAEVQNGDFIPEWTMYALVGRANNEKAIKFQIWTAHIITDLRKKGVVILEGAEKETIDFEVKYGNYRIRKTFANSSNIVEDYREFVELSKAEWKAKRLNNNDRIKLSNIIVNALEERISANALSMKGSEILQVQEIISEIKSDIIKLSNKKHGGIKTAMTKELKELSKQVNEKEYVIDVLGEELKKNNKLPNEGEYITLDVHGFSNNYMYKYENGGTYKTDAYKAWIKYFPVQQLPTIDYWNLDIDKPIEMFINYVAKGDMDIRNLDKSLIDTVFHEYGINDNKIKSVHSQRVGTVEDYKEGKIYIYIRNI